MDSELLKSELRKKGLEIIFDNIETKNMITVSNGKYKAILTINLCLSNIETINKKWFEYKNKYIVENLNKYFEYELNNNFICLSTLDDFKSRDSIIKVQCLRCKTIIDTSLRKIRKKNNLHRGLTCPNCDGRTESLHALVLKQLFKHYYPDSIIEDQSCINPNTNYIMATDIVNHRLKIAIEILGQWHKYEEQKERDFIKKKFWIDKGYSFYDYEIDGISVLDYARYFFPNLDKIPDWVNVEYSNKLNYIKIQKMLNDGMKVLTIADKLEIKVHRIYDALYCGKLYYPDDYIKSTRRPIVQLSMNKEYIADYISYSEAAIANNIDKSGILTCVYTKSYYSNGYYWIPKDLYDTGNYVIPSNRLDKFYVKVNKINADGEIIAVFNNLYDAAKDVDTIASKIYEVCIGKKKTTKNFHYEFA